MTIIKVSKLLQDIDDDIKFIDEYKLHCNHFSIRFINRRRLYNIDFTFYDDSQKHILSNYYRLLMDDKHINTLLDIYQDFIHNHTNIKEHHKDMICNIIQKYKVSS